MSFTAVQSAEGTLTQNAVTTVNFGTGASTPIRYSYVAVTNDSAAASPVPIYFTTDGTVPTVGGEDCFAVDPNDTMVIANGAGLWTQAQSVIQAGTQVAPTSYTTASTPWQATPYGSSLGGGVANPGTTVKLISSGTMAFTVSGSG